MTAPADVGAAQRGFMLSATRLPTLWDLDDDAYRLLTLLENVNDPELVAEFEAELALIDLMLMEKTEGYVSVIRSLERMAEARKAEADRLRDRAKTAQNHADWLRERLLTYMHVAERPRIETARFEITIRANPGRIEVTDAALVPNQFNKTVVTTTVDKVAVREAITKDGVVVPGCELVKSDRLAIA